MGDKHCAWGTCNCDSRDKEKEDMMDVKFYSFPKLYLQVSLNENTVKCRNCIQACGRCYSQWNLQKIDQHYKKHKYYYVVCSKHFPDGRPTDQFPNPVPAEVSSQVEKAPKRKAPIHSKANVCTKKKKKKQFL